MTEERITSPVGAFTSAQIKLAALIRDHRPQAGNGPINSPRGSSKTDNKNNNNNHHHHHRLCSSSLLFPLLATLMIALQASTTTAVTFTNQQLLTADSQWGVQQQQQQHHPYDLLARHQTHYMNVVPSSHFRYNEGRQVAAGPAARETDELQERSAAGSPVDHGHIYKRSSALVTGPITYAGGSAEYTALLSSSGHHHHNQLTNNPLRRRMMSEGAHQRWTAPQMMTQQVELARASSEQADNEPAESAEAPVSQQRAPARTGNRINEAELLRQKQHIQYHDQWPSVAGKCHKRTLNFCASVLPFNTTTFPNIIGDTNRFEVKRSLPFFGFLAKSSCNKRLDELLCLLLEPPCSSQSGLALPPCKKFCRLALEGCNEYIPATLAMSSVFDCRQYPESNDPSVCINLAQGDACGQDEFKCPDKTCIPHNWLCDGVRDCLFAADEANCTGVAGSGNQPSVCSTEEFKCDGKCVPKAWKCDGERDCLDGSDEEACDLRPRCGPDRFKCADGNGCIPKRWVCDGKAECRDGSDETNCDQRQCSQNDFKCDNGICIPKLWRCDRQADCKDGSDERSCVYPAPTTTEQPATSRPANQSEPASPPIDQQQQHQQQVVVETAYYAAHTDAPARGAELATVKPEPSVTGEDVSRIIQQEQVQKEQEQKEQEQKEQRQPEVAQEQAQTVAVMMADAQRPQRPAELKKFDYDIIQSNGHPNEAPLRLDQGKPIELQQAERKERTPIVGRVELSPQRARSLSQGQISAPERVPIYRSLFKTLKAGGQLAGVRQNTPGGQYRYAMVGGRRMRGDRKQPVSEQQQQQQQQQQVQMVMTTLEPAKPAVALTPSPGSQPEAAASTGNQTVPALPTARGHSVASYLQLLNTRYNLRLARVSPMPPVKLRGSSPSSD